MVDVILDEPRKRNQVLRFDTTAMLSDDSDESEDDKEFHGSVGQKAKKKRGWKKADGKRFFRAIQKWGIGRWSQIQADGLSHRRLDSIRLYCRGFLMQIVAIGGLADDPFLLSFVNKKIEELALPLGPEFHEATEVAESTEASKAVEEGAKADSPDPKEDDVPEPIDAGLTHPYFLDKIVKEGKRIASQL
jgi:hypothetical protein